MAAHALAHARVPTHFCVRMRLLCALWSEPMWSVSCSGLWNTTNKDEDSQVKR